MITLEIYNKRLNKYNDVEYSVVIDSGLYSARISAWMSKEDIDSAIHSFNADNVPFRVEPQNKEISDELFEQIKYIGGEKYSAEFKRL